MVKRLFRRLTCRHRWIIVARPIILPEIYGCVECGKVAKIQRYDVDEWQFKRKMKGETFDD